MPELPPPDLMDHGGRLRRLVLALIVGASCGAIGYLIASHLSEPDLVPPDGVYTAGHDNRIFGFIFYMTGFTGALGFVATLAFLNYRVKLAERRENQLPTARKVK